MTSRSLDGEFIARVISRMGFLPVRGSSSRGGQRALLEMNQLLTEGHSVAFTIDGPRGPRNVAKKGPVLLSRISGVPVIAFYVAVERAWVLNTWDGLMIPKPFSRILRPRRPQDLRPARCRRCRDGALPRRNASCARAHHRLGRIAVFDSQLTHPSPDSTFKRSPDRDAQAVLCQLWFARSAPSAELGSGCKARAAAQL